MRIKIPDNETERLNALRSYGILDTLPEQAYDDIANLAAAICDTPIALITLIDSDRQWFKSKIGFEIEQTQRDIAFCSTAILKPNEIHVVSDAETDESYAGNPLVSGAPHIRFYAGAPLVTENGEALGTLCVIDRKPRELSEKQKLGLRVLARQVMTQIELRKRIEQMKRLEEERTAAETALRESEKKYRHLFEYSRGLICIHDTNGVILSVNQAAAQTLGYQTDEIIGKSLKNFLAPKTLPFFDDYKQQILKNTQFEGMMIVKTKSGDERFWKFHNTVYADSKTSEYIIGYAQDVTELKLAQKELENLSLCDDLTGLYNRRGFFTLAEQALKVARRMSKQCVVIYADLDGLKKVNDTFGHNAGSRMIVDASNIFKSFFRESDIAARIGGDEFVILVQNISESSVEILKTRLQEKLDDYNRAATNPYFLSMSLGFAFFDPQNQTTIEELVALADEMMYVQKRNKKAAN